MRPQCSLLPFITVLLLGATVGSLFSGIPSDRFGRKPTIIFSGVLFIVGVIVASYLAHSVAVLIVGRMIIGLAVGVTSGVTPLFIAEVAPKHLRGGLVMMFQASIVRFPAGAVRCG